VAGVSVSPTPSGPLVVAFVPGVTPDKWARTWREREPVPLELLPVEEDAQRSVLDDGTADLAFVRLPVDREGLHLIPLYTERAVVVVAREHPAAAYDELPLADLAHEQLVHGEVPGWEEVVAVEQLPFPPMSAKEAVEVVASGTGIAVLPMSVARLHHRRDVVHRPVVDLPGTEVGLAWRRDAGDDPRIEAFIGVVRGRTARSSRGAGADPPAPKQPARRPARRDPTSGRTPPRGRRRGRR
jgi:DNA-binding transcriptional LysR family regulator